MLYKATQAASHSITLKILRWIFLTKLTSPCLFSFPLKDLGMCSQPLAVFSLFFWKILRMRTAGWKCSGNDLGSVQSCAPLPDWWQKGARWWRAEPSSHSIKWLHSMAVIKQPCFTLLWDQVHIAVFFSAQCKIWRKWAFFLLLLLLGLCRHHLNWPTTISLPLPSAFIQISSSITCDSYKWNLQLFCPLADFCSHRSRACLSFEASCLKSVFGCSFHFWTCSLVQGFIFFW